MAGITPSVTAYIDNPERLDKLNRFDSLCTYVQKPPVSEESKAATAALATNTGAAAVRRPAGLYERGRCVGALADCCLNYTQSDSYPSAWYAFDAGNARFYVLDGAWDEANVGPADEYKNDYAAHWTPTSAEYQWLKQDLAVPPYRPIRRRYFISCWWR